MKKGKKEFKARRPPVKRQRKRKFNYQDSSYVKDRDFKNEEIEKRRRLLEEKRLQDLPSKSHNEEESSEEEENPLQELLKTFSENKRPTKVSVLSDSESEESNCEELENSSDLDFRNQDSDSSDKGSDKEISYKSEEDIENDNAIQNYSNLDNCVVQFVDNDEEDEETNKEDAGHLKDPFSIHYRNDLDDKFYEILLNQPVNSNTYMLQWPILGNLFYQIPKNECTNQEPNSKESKVPILLEGKQFAAPGTIPKIINQVKWNDLYVKSLIQQNLTRANYNNIKDTLDTDNPTLTPIQKELFSIINNYQDLLFTERTFENENQIRFVYSLHAINHILKTRTKILHHNAKIQKLKSNDPATMHDIYQDQGLVRPKVLIVVPFRQSCLQIVEILIAIFIGEEKGGSVINKLRFMEDFGGNNIIMPKKNPKPEDYEQTFKGNTDDSFKIGISITKKALKLYSDFYSSDIIISSVLGLRMIIGAEGESDRDFDFLASIELLIMDQADIFYMQNWDHLLHIFDHLHLQPKDSHGTDFSRIRSWCINGWSKYYRQTLIFSSIQLPEILNIFNKRCFNYAGKARVTNTIISGSINQVIVQVPQVFQKFEVINHLKVHDVRFEYFTKTILPQYKDSIMNHTLIFIPSYFDYVKLRNYFRNEELNFVQICEYSKDAKVARARDMFFHSDAHFLLYTERFHFFRRIRIKGIRHIIFYGPPTFPHFYSELCNLMQEINQNRKAGSMSNMSVKIIYCKYDIMSLSNIVGTVRANKMILSNNNTHMIMTNG